MAASMKRRAFTRAMGAVVAGVIAGSRLQADQKKPEEKSAKHVCKGRNECQGQGGCFTPDSSCAGMNACKGTGGCATVAKHTCKTKNECRGQGGCKTADNGCAGKNSCKGKGGCAVPVKAEIKKQKSSV